MFAAAIIACHIAYANVCMTVTDRWGPYQTEQECKDRLLEMTVDLMKIWRKHGAPVKVVMWECVTPDKARLSS